MKQQPAPVDQFDQLSRHALVMAIWTPSALVAVVLLSLGLSSGAAWWVFAAVALLLATFAGHIIVNVVTASRFTSAETALGATAFAVMLLTLITARLLDAPWLEGDMFIMLGLGLAALLGAVVIYMLIAFGPRSALERFDVIRDNNLRPASRLKHRGGRR